MDNEFPITLVILDRPYKMKVTAEEEETIRKAVHRINQRAGEYKSIRLQGHAGYSGNDERGNVDKNNKTRGKRPICEFKTDEQTRRNRKRIGPGAIIR
jgi:hypothetical protein